MCESIKLFRLTIEPVNLCLPEQLHKQSYVLQQEVVYIWYAHNMFSQKTNPEFLWFKKKLFLGKKITKPMWLVIKKNHEIIEKSFFVEKFGDQLN